MNRHAVPGHALAWDATAASLGFAAVYFFLARGYLVSDGPTLIASAQTGCPGPYWFHTGLLKLLAVGGGLGWERSGHLISATFGGAAMAMCLVGCRWTGMCRWSAWLATLVCGTSAAQLFQSTMIEKRTALQLGTIAIPFSLLVHTGASGWIGDVLLAVAVAVALMLHPAVALMLPLAILWIGMGWTTPGRPWGARLRSVSLVGLASYMVMALVVPRAAPAYVGPRVLEAAFQSSSPLATRLGLFLWNDVMIGAGGVLVLGLLGHGRHLPGISARARWTLLCLLPAVISSVQLIDLFGAADDWNLMRGAYLIPALPMAAWFLFPRQLGRLLPLIAILLATNGWLAWRWMVVIAPPDPSPLALGVDEALQNVRARGYRESVVLYAAPQQMTASLLRNTQPHQAVGIWTVALSQDAAQEERCAIKLLETAHDIVRQRPDNALILAPGILEVLSFGGRAALGQRLRDEFTWVSIARGSPGDWVLLMER